MTRFEFHTTTGSVVDLIAPLDKKEMNSYLGEFRTHCRVEHSAYQYNHFVNYMNKYYGIKIEYYIPDNRVVRVDM